MEEDLEILKEFLELKEIHSSNDIRMSYLTIYQEAVRNLIARYKELKEAEEIERHNYQVAIAETIHKSKVKEKKKELDDEDLEIYDTDSEDVIISKYEDRAVLDFCNSILED